MNHTRIYPCINSFKLAAAFLVIMIHTSPLSSVCGEADFILTRILARIAVPFFFMVTGFFILPRALTKPVQGIRYLKHIGCLYLVSVVLYLPVNLYAGQLQGLGPGQLLKLFLTDGTFYHLWYLPALLLGFCLVWTALRHLPLKIVCILSLLLYLAGLFGDSYYGFLPEGSLVQTAYQAIFHVSSYTRNGLFYAPVFLLLGYLISIQKHSRQKTFISAPGFSTALFCFCLSLALLLFEGIALRLLQVQRHDSMYLCLIPVMYFLFHILLKQDRPVLPACFPKELPLFLYLLHPLFLILVRGFAGITGFDLLITNSVIHFLAVASASFFGSWILAVLKKWKEENL